MVNEQSKRKSVIKDSLFQISAFDASDGNDSVDPNDVYTTILKIPGIDNLLKTMNDSEMDDEKVKDMIKPIIDIHSAECKFYNNLAPIFDVPVPKVFNTLEWIIGKQDGCIHMEDLSQKGKVLSFFDGINLTQIKNVIRHLAHMHKNVLDTDETIWQGKYPPNPVGLDNFLDMLIPTIDIFYEKCKRKGLLCFKRAVTKWVPEVCKILIRCERAVVILKGQQELDVLYAFKSIFKKLGKIIRNKSFYQYGFNNDEIKLKSVIIHGDLHLGNIMWEINKNGEVQNDIAAFIDWQIMYEGSPMNDLARFLAMCGSGVIRRQAEEFAIDFYLECLLKEFGGDASKVPYTREQLKMSYDYVFVCHIVFIISAAIFFFADVKEPERSIRDAYWDSSELKIFAACEDAIRLLENEMKDIFEKFNN
uniref:CHK kinase-like domain-containing protein n=1 Tax=Panagrolaimus davidi TaxID=227884 RepID=A0A914PLZ4_9BILA